VRLGEELGRVAGDHQLPVFDARGPGREDPGLRHAGLLRRDALHPDPDEGLQLALVANGEGKAAGDLFRRRQRQRNTADVSLGRHLLVGGSYHFSVTILVRAHQPNDDRDGLRSRVAELDAVLGERRAEVAWAKSDLDAFGIEYRRRVGLLHERLDKLELEITEAELGELSKQVKSDSGGSRESPAAARPEPLRRYTSDAARRLFRDVAKAIHPDLSRDEATRDRRHTLMIEANRAYALGDEEQLRSILEAWETSPEAVRGSDAEAMRLRLVRRIGQIEDELERLARDLAALKDSPLGKLKAMVDEAAAQGKDLVRDMVGRLKRDILVATNRLDAMRPPR
jgi:hypothetical protein